MARAKKRQFEYIASAWVNRKHSFNKNSTFIESYEDITPYLKSVHLAVSLFMKDPGLMSWARSTDLSPSSMSLLEILKGCVRAIMRLKLMTLDSSHAFGIFNNAVMDLMKRWQRKARGEKWLPTAVRLRWLIKETCERDKLLKESLH